MGESAFLELKKTLYRTPWPPGNGDQESITMKYNQETGAFLTSTNNNFMAQGPFGISLTLRVSKHIELMIAYRTGKGRLDDDRLEELMAQMDDIWCEATDEEVAAIKFYTDLYYNEGSFRNDESVLSSSPLMYNADDSGTNRPSQLTGYRFSSELTENVELRYA